MLSTLYAIPTGRGLGSCGQASNEAIVLVDNKNKPSERSNTRWISTASSVYLTGSAHDRPMLLLLALLLWSFRDYYGRWQVFS